MPPTSALAARLPADSSHLRATEIGLHPSGYAEVVAALNLLTEGRVRRQVVLGEMGGGVHHRHTAARVAGAMAADLSPAGLESDRQHAGGSGRRRESN